MGAGCEVIVAEVYDPNNARFIASAPNLEHELAQEKEENAELRDWLGGIVNETAMRGGSLRAINEWAVKALGGAPCPFSIPARAWPPAPEEKPIGKFEEDVARAELETFQQEEGNQ